MSPCAGPADDLPAPLGRRSSRLPLPFRIAAKPRDTNVVPTTESPIKPQSVAAVSLSSIPSHARLSAACRAQLLPPSQRSKPNPTPERVQGRRGHYAAAAATAAMMFACSVAAAHAAQQVAASYSLGTWSTANLSVARESPAATSLPNHGVAIFAGGASTCCHGYFFRVFAC